MVADCHWRLLSFEWAWTAECVLQFSVLLLYRSVDLEWQCVHCIFSFPRSISRWSWVAACALQTAMNGSVGAADGLGWQRALCVFPFLLSHRWSWVTGSVCAADFHFRISLSDDLRWGVFKFTGCHLSPFGSGRTVKFDHRQQVSCSTNQWLEHQAKHTAHFNCTHQPKYHIVSQPTRINQNPQRTRCHREIGD